MQYVYYQIAFKPWLAGLVHGLKGVPPSRQAAVGHDHGLVWSGLYMAWFDGFVA